MTEECLMHVDGADGQIELYESRVVITRNGFMNKIAFGFVGEKDIPYGSIATVDYKPASFWASGYIEFIISGQQPTDPKKKSMTRVQFNKKNLEDFTLLKEKVFEAIEAHSHHH